LEFTTTPRVALLAGKLGQGGAEKQLVYMARALCQAGVDVRLYSLTRGEFHEAELQRLGLPPCWVGRFSSPLARLATLTAALRQFRPHIVQSAHFYTNLYASLSGRLCRAVAIGALRSDLAFHLETHGRWARWLLHMPSALLANSYAAKRDLEGLSIRAKISVIPNVIDLAGFDAPCSEAAPSLGAVGRPVAVALGNLIAVKRLERFLLALAQARRVVAGLTGVIIGDGPERPDLEQRADALGLLPEGVRFMGRRNDVPALLKQADMLVLCSDHEGFPNVLLEAMAARLPVITTPVGDGAVVVQDGVTGYLVACHDVDGMAERMARVAGSPNLRRQLGEAGRKRAEQEYSFESLAARLLLVYQNL
jgi:glycosyltransferase involved in cell wall biosynthesis